MKTLIASDTQYPQGVSTVVKTGFRFSQNCLRTLTCLGFAAFILVCGPALAATAPSLGSASTYGVVSSTFTNANTAPQTIINGDVCYTTGPTTPPLTINGTITTPCDPARGGEQGLALANLNGQACVSLGAAVTLDSVIIGANPPGVIPPGCYSSTGAMNVTLGTTVTLNGAGVYIFRPGGALTTGANSRVILAGGACASDVFWTPIGATTLGANAALSPTPTFVGNILDAAGISIGHFANLTGRALAFGGTVTTDAATITVPTCAAFPGGGTAIPSLAKGFNPVSIIAGSVSSLTIRLTNANPIVATLSAPLIDTLPAGVVIAPTPNASTTCGGGATVSATAGGTTVTLPAGRSIPGGSPGTCTVSVDVTSATAGSYVNTLAAGALQTNNGNNAAPATATLAVGGPVPIPTLSEWAMVLLAALLALAGFAALRRQER